MEFNWYQKLSNSDQLEQGDIIPECPILIPPSVMEVDGQYDVEVLNMDTIILSQSCDLVNDKIDIVLVCPIYTLSVFKESLPAGNQGATAFKKHVENLKKGHLPSYHLLNKDSELDLHEYLVVDFKNVYGIHVNNLRGIAGSLADRIRLNPPYREHLSQAFARYFMRVGLPQDLVVEGI